MSHSNSQPPSSPNLGIDHIVRPVKSQQSLRKSVFSATHVEASPTTLSPRPQIAECRHHTSCGPDSSQGCLPPPIAVIPVCEAHVGLLLASSCQSQLDGASQNQSVVEIGIVIDNVDLNPIADLEKHRTIPTCSRNRVISHPHSTQNLCPSLLFSKPLPQWGCSKHFFCHNVRSSRTCDSFTYFANRPSCSPCQGFHRLAVS
jgi:hypothetical protein